VRWLSLLGLLALAAHAAPAAPTKAPSANLGITKSVFVSDGAVRKDPFFPTSTRLRTKPGDAGKQSPKADFSGLLVLKGITGTPERRIVLINNKNFTSGEELEVRAGSGKFNIRVMEIREKSVLVSIEGVTQPKELLLQDKLLPFGERN